VFCSALSYNLCYNTLRYSLLYLLGSKSESAAIPPLHRIHVVLALRYPLLQVPVLRRLGRLLLRHEAAEYREGEEGHVDDGRDQSGVGRLLVRHGLRQRDDIAAAANHRLDDEQEQGGEGGEGAAAPTATLEILSEEGGGRRRRKAGQEVEVKPKILETSELTETDNGRPGQRHTANGTGASET
jgi:hypothetical protein